MVRTDREWLDRQYHPRGLGRWGARARLVGQDANDPRYDGKGTTPQARARMRAAAETLASARQIMIASRENGTGGEDTEVVSGELLVAARRQLGGERTRRGGASAVARVRLEAATADLDKAEAEATAAAQAGNALSPIVLSPDTLALPLTLIRHTAAAQVGNALSQAMPYYKLAPSSLP